MNQIIARLLRAGQGNRFGHPARIVPILAVLAGCAGPTIEASRVASDTDSAPESGRYFVCVVEVLGTALCDEVSKLLDQADIEYWAAGEMPSVSPSSSDEEAALDALAFSVPEDVGQRASDLLEREKRLRGPEWDRVEVLTPVQRNESRFVFHGRRVPVRPQ